MSETMRKEEHKRQCRQRRQRLRLPSSATQALQQGQEKLNALSKPRAWALPQTTIPAEVTHYRQRNRALRTLKRRGPLPSHSETDVAATAPELALKIDAALNFAELSHGADPFVKPILLYYSCAHLCGVYTRAYLNWQHDKHAHGLRCTGAACPSDVGSTKLTVESQGLFPLLATTCFLMSGAPSCFCELVTYSSTPTGYTGAGEHLENFGKTEVAEPLTCLTLDNLANFDYPKELRKVRLRHGFHKFNGLATTAFLVDVMTLFLASSLARYDVLAWREVLDGKSNSYRIHFEETFNRFEAFTIDRLLECLEDPSVTLDAAVTPCEHSPYSHDDRRFGGIDPNCA